MSERQIRNAIIESVSLGYEDHGILTAYVRLTYGGGVQSFGGYALGFDPKFEDKSLRKPYLALFVQRVLEVVGVECWEDLPGKPVRADADGGTVHRLGNFLEDKWFSPEKEFKAMKEGK